MVQPVYLQGTVQCNMNIHSKARRLTCDNLRYNSHGPEILVFDDLGDGFTHRLLVARRETAYTEEHNRTIAFRNRTPYCSAELASSLSTWTSINRILELL
jgi:hypothetical protein